MTRKEAYTLGRNFWLRNQRPATLPEVMALHTPADTPHEGIREAVKNIWWKNWRLGEVDARDDRENERQAIIAEAEAAGATDAELRAITEGWK
jgi:hypothetical protein